MAPPTKQEAIRRHGVHFLLVLLHSTGAWSTTSGGPAPVCAGSREPVALAEALGFCGGGGGGGGGLSCCDADDDAAIRAELDGMRITDANCAAIVKTFLCARCLPSLSAMLFNSADSPSTMTMKKVAVPLLCNSTNSSTSAQGQPHPPSARLPWEQDTLCLEQISTASYLTVAAHPDGSGRVFLSSRDGKIWLASVPEQGSGGALHVGSSPFLDITDRVHHDAVLGLVGVAFHPEFATNGRFFVSYHCDSSTSQFCGAGRCWGPAAGNGSQSQLCRYQLVVSEFSAKGGPDYSKATRAYPSEVRRIFTVGLPHPHPSYSYQQHGGQILFQPSDSDGYLYLITGNGGFSKNERSFLGKIIRFYVGGEDRWTSDGAAPKMDKPEIYATGLNNPSGCSFDSNRPSYLYCTNVNKEQCEQVYLITRARNYGGSPLKVTVSIIINRGRPADGRMPSIVGGLMYRGSADLLLEGRYLYIYASSVWAGMDAPESRSNGRYASVQAPIVRCSRSSPVPCSGIGITAIAGRVLSLGEDSRKDTFVLATRGVFRVVPPSLCGVTPTPLPAPHGAGWVLSVVAFALLLAFYQVWSTIFGGGGQIGSCIECFREISCCNFYFGEAARQRRARSARND